MIVKTFLRLERDFDKHVNYCRDESNAQEFLFNNNEAREFFEVIISVSFCKFKNSLFSISDIQSLLMILSLLTAI